MAKEARLVQTVALGDDASTTAARRAHERALDGKNELAFLGDLGLEDADIGDVERYRDERVLGHQRLSLHVLVSHGAILPYLDLRRNPYI
jgi:hypothetical protein